MDVKKVAVLFLGVVLALGNAEKDKQMGWWKHAVIYQIYPKSFQSSTGNGTGDLKGILDRYDYIKYLGVDAIWLNPIFPSKSNADAGYDISDYKDVDPSFGTIQDLKNLIKACHNDSVKVILDFVPNHSSNLHPWFLSSKTRSNGYDDYYVWRDPGPALPNSNELQPPNNWRSIINGIAWTYDQDRKQFYLHQFMKEQPDLNYNNPRVRKEMQDVLSFWLDMDIDGFRMDAVFTTWEDLSFKDEPALPGQTITDYGSMNHIYTAEQPECYKILQEFREVLDNYTRTRDGFERIMFTESYNKDFNVLAKYYGTPEKPISQFPFNFILLQNLRAEHIGSDWAENINYWLKNMPMDKYWPNWVLGNHDNNRISSRFSPEHSDIIHMSLMTLPGTYIIYFGDELALQDSYVRWDQGIDPQGKDSGKKLFQARTRDSERGPMPWDDSDNGGFSVKRPWIPLTSDKTVTVKAQMNDPKSHLQLFRRLVQMRKLNTYRNGDVLVGTANSTVPEVLIITRSIIDHPTIVTLANFGTTRQAIDLKKYRPTLPDEMYVYAASLNAPVEHKQKVKINPIVLEPISGLILSTATLD